MDQKGKMPWSEKVPNLYGRPEKRRATPDVVPRNDSSGAPRSEEETGPRSVFQGNGFQLAGSGNVSARDIYIGATSNSEREILKDLRITDPRDDKVRIQRTKGGLLQESYCWILDHEDYRRWHDDEQSRLLWIKGDPGKGKTMLLCGIIDELEKLPAGTYILSYFFCQATDVRLNSATAVLRGLMYQLLDQEPSLIGCIQKKYDHAGKQLFEDINSWDALSQILLSILQELSSQNIYLVVDALDECETNLDQLLHLIVQVSSSSQAKWILSSRNRRDIEQLILPTESRMGLSLELKENAEHIFHAVNMYITQCISELPGLKEDPELQDQVQNEMRLKADGTFLWVALVVQELREAKAQSWEILEIMNDVPAGLDELYERMMQQIQRLGRKNPEFCGKLLSTVTAAYRPLHLAELQALADLPPNISNIRQNLMAVAALCGSFLTIRDNVVYLIHQSAKDFLTRHVSLFPSGMAQEHTSIALRSIQIMSTTLKRDIYNLLIPGFPIEDVKTPEPDPLSSARYSCIHWVSHLAHGNPGGLGQDGRNAGLGDLVHEFLKKHYLHWLEAISILRSMSPGILSVSRLLSLVQMQTETSGLRGLVQDAFRFIRAHRVGIESSPLQAYSSALVFSPEKSKIRQLFREEEPKWMIAKPAMEDEWGACIQTFEGHRAGVTSVAFSSDATELASASYDTTVKLWKVSTGQCIRTFRGHSTKVSSVAFSLDGTHLLSASSDTTVRLWNKATGQCLRKFEGHYDMVTSAIFLGDTATVVSASLDMTVRLWNTETGQCIQTLKGHGCEVYSIALSGDTLQLASGSDDSTINIWNTVTGQCLQTIEDHVGLRVLSMAFLDDTKQLASASIRGTIKLWNVATGRCLRTFEYQYQHVDSVVFSGNATQLVLASSGNAIELLGANTAWRVPLSGSHDSDIASVAASHDMTQIALAIENTVKLWDTTIGQRQWMPKDHTESVSFLAFSGDAAQMVSVSFGGAIILWDAVTGQCIYALEGCSDKTTSAVFSGDGSRLVSASVDGAVKVWNLETGQLILAFDGCDDKTSSAAFSRDGRQLLTVSLYGNIKIWNIETGQCLREHEWVSNAISSVVWSGDAAYLAWAGMNKTVHVWDTATGQCLQKFRHNKWLQNLSFERTGTQLYTEMGIIDMEKSSNTGQLSFRLPETEEEKARFEGYEISDDRAWITRYSKRILWLPPDYRPEVYAVLGSTVYIDCSSGRVLIFRFPD